MLPAAPTQNQPDPGLLRKLAVIELIYLGAVALIALINLVVWFMPELGRTLAGHWWPMNPQAALAALLSAASLALSRPGFTKKSHLPATALAALTALVTSTALAGYLLHKSFALGPFSVAHAGFPAPDKMPLSTAWAFALLSIVMLLMSARAGLASLLADVAVSGFCLLVMIVVTGNVYGALHLFGSEWKSTTPALTLIALALLAFVAFTRRAQYGWFAMFLGSGAGGKVARIAAPFVLLVAFLPEPARVQASRVGLLPAEFASALVAALAVALGFGILLMLVFRMNALEKRVRDLSLRDELTGLYNRRGFYLLAWQALRQARRSGLPFSVIFIDLENIPQINASLGFRAGSEALAEVADLLRATIRETDVIARIGGDEFAVGGHFTEKVVATLTLRLKEAATYRNADPGRNFSLNFTLGHVTAADPQRVSLEALLASAGKALDEGKSDPPSMAD